MEWDSKGGSPSTSPRNWIFMKNNWPIVFGKIRVDIRTKLYYRGKIGHYDGCHVGALKRLFAGFFWWGGGEHFSSTFVKFSIYHI